MKVDGTEGKKGEGLKFHEEIGRSAKDFLRAGRERKNIWFYAYAIGVGGWLLALPIAAGAFLGSLLDRKMQSGGTSWTITFILIGVAAGVYNVWYFLIRRPS